MSEVRRIYTRITKFLRSLDKGTVHNRERGVI